MAKNFLACRIATTNGEDLSLEGGVILYAMRAQVGTGYPSMPLHGAACCLGAFFMSLVNFTGDIPACKEKATNNMKKETSVHMHIFMREYLF